MATCRNDDGRATGAVRGSRGEQLSWGYGSGRAGVGYGKEDMMGKGRFDVGHLFRSKDHKTRVRLALKHLVIL
jgi:hypothetical protein